MWILNHNAWNKDSLLAKLWSGSPRPSASISVLVEPSFNKNSAKLVQKEFLISDQIPHPPVEPWSPWPALSQNPAILSILAWFSKNPIFLDFPLGDFPSTVRSPALLHTCTLMSTLENPCTAAWHAPLSMRFSLQRYWSRLPCPSPGDTPDLDFHSLHYNSHTGKKNEITTKPNFINWKKSIHLKLLW